MLSVATLSDALGSSVAYSFWDSSTIYIFSIALQVAGALILLVTFCGKTEDKIIDSYFADGHFAHIIKGKVTMKRDRIRECVKKIYLNRASFGYIATGYFLGIYGKLDETKVDQIAITIFLLTIFLIGLGFFLSHVIACVLYREDWILPESKLSKNAGVDVVEF